MIPILISLVSGVIAWLLITKGGCNEEALHAAASAYASVAVTMLGFMMAMLAILVTIADRRLIRNMAKTGHYDRLLHQMYWSSAYFGVATLGALLSLFMTDQWLAVGMALDSGLVAGACYLVICVGRKLRTILVLVTPTEKRALD